MKKLPRYIFIVICASSGILLLLELADYAGFYTNPVVRLLLIALYTMACFSSYLWVPKFLLATMRIRKPLLEEEEWLHPLCHELNLRTGINPMPEILILEAPELNAFATGKKTIIISRGLLVQLSEPEIKAILAHEYGHLIHGDTRSGGAFAMAMFIPLKIYGYLNFLFKGHKKKGIPKKRNLIQPLLFAVLLSLIAYQFPEFVLLIVFFFIYWKLFPKLQRLITIVWCCFCHRDEYKQDQFAQSLGCGRQLKSALLKIDAIDSENLVSGLQQLFSSHPMLYARIRRLEWLEGLRPTP